MDVAGGDEGGEVEILEEVKSGETRREGRRDRREEDDKSSEGRGAPRWDGTDKRYVMVKLDTKPITKEILNRMWCD